MPIPTPKNLEKSDKESGKNKFISRCMSSEIMNKEFPDQKRRAAVCFSQWKRKSKESEANIEPKWEDVENENVLFLD